MKSIYYLCLLGIVLVAGCGSDDDEVEVINFIRYEINGDEWSSQSAESSFNILQLDGNILLSGERFDDVGGTLSPSGITLVMASPEQSNSNPSFEAGIPYSLDKCSGMELISSPCGGFVVGIITNGVEEGYGNEDAETQFNINFSRLEYVSGGRCEGSFSGVLRSTVTNDLVEISNGEFSMNFF